MIDLSLLSVEAAMRHPHVERGSIDDWNPANITNWIMKAQQCSILRDVFDAPMLVTSSGLLMLLPTGEPDEAEPYMMWGFELMTTTVRLPVLLHTLQEQVVATVTEWPRPIMAATQTFQTLDWNGFHNWQRDCTSEEHLRHLMLASPVSRMGHSWDFWIAGLSQRRRRRVKLALQREDLVARITSNEGMSFSEMMWARQNIIDRWDQPNAALAQLYWACSASNSAPDRSVIVRVEGGGKTVALAVFLQRDTGLIYQCFARLPGDPYPDVGTFVFASLMQWLHGPEARGRWTHVDPTCRTMFTEHTIDTYKRCIINENRWLPLLTVADSATLENVPFQPPYYHVEQRQWIVGETPTLSGEPV